MKNLFLLSKALLIASAMATVSIGSATGILYQNALPTINLNGNPSINTVRSNAAVVQQNYTGNPLIGDAFYLSGAGSYTVDSISVYAISNGLAGTSNAPSTEFSNISLYYGPDGSPLGNSAILANAAAITAASSPLPVKYNGTTDYQSLYSSNFFSIYKITFSGLNWTVSTGQFYDFAVGGAGIGANTFALSVSDPNNSGAQEDQQQGQFLFFSNTATPLLTGASAAIPCTGPKCPTINNFVHPADLNFIITGAAAVPEPSTLGMLGLGLGALAMRLRRKQS